MKRADIIGLRFYGISRILLGVLQLGGFLLIYLGRVRIIGWGGADRDIPMFAGVLLIGIFHFGAGIGLVRLRTWVSSWLQFGWLAFLLSVPLVYWWTYRRFLTLGIEWADPAVGRALLGAILIILWVGFDVFYIARLKFPTAVQTQT